jgi:hypothetical protein
LLQPHYSTSRLSRQSGYADLEQRDLDVQEFLRILPEIPDQ